MGTKNRARTRRKRRVISKMSKIEFNMKAIRAIKKRKERVGKDHSNKSKPKGR
jgi:hypothetical protein